MLGEDRNQKGKERGSRGAHIKPWQFECILSQIHAEA